MFKHFLKLKKICNLQEMCYPNDPLNCVFFYLRYYSWKGIYYVRLKKYNKNLNSLLLCVN